MGGYIHSPELFAKYGKDTFLHRNFAEQEFVPGDEVSFSIELREDGLPQARGARALRAAGGNPLAYASAGSLNGRISGTVVSFNPKKGWGYIHSPELFHQYGKDTFLHRNFMMEELSIGDAVSYMMELREDGMPQARDVRSQNRPGRFAAAPAAHFSPAPAQHAIAQRYSGTVVSYNAAKGWGYIHTPELLAHYGKDTFLHRKFVSEELNIGDVVSYLLDFREDGMPQARDVRAQKALGRNAAASATQSRSFAHGGGASGRFSGTVASFNPLKGWGYIHSPELFNQYGKDTFLHKNFMVEELNAGDEVTYSIELRDDGMPQARDVRIKKRKGATNAAAGAPAQKRQKQ